MGRPNTGARQHGHWQLGNHGHVDADTIALGHPEALQRVGEGGDLGEQVGVGDRAGIAWFAFPMERNLVAAAGFDVAIQAVVRHIERAFDEPLGVGQLPIENRVKVAVPRHQLSSLASPEPQSIGRGLLVQRLVGGQRGSLKRGGRRKGPVLDLVVLNRRL